MSREHILPRWLIETASEPLTFSGAAQAVFKGQSKIYDVCKACNNGTLSRLDDYMKRLWLARLATFVLEDESIAFHYDYGMLLRWLLKTSFNAARAEKRGLRAFDAQIIEYILDGGAHPQYAHIYLSLIKPTVSQARRIMPEARRCSRIKNDLHFHSWETFIIAIRSFQFLVGIQVDECNAYEASQYFKSIKATMPGELLEAGKSSVTVSTSHYHTLAAYGKHFNVHADKYQPFAKEAADRKNIIVSQTTYVAKSIIPRL